MAAAVIMSTGLPVGFVQFCKEIWEAPDNKMLSRLGLKVAEDARKSGVCIYTASVRKKNGVLYFLYKYGNAKKLAVYSDLKTKLPGFEAEVISSEDNQNSASQGIVYICPLNRNNVTLIRKLFPYTLPSNHKGKPLTIGLGDRLGAASPGHIRLLAGKNVFPVLAQQSIRELNLTGRTYEDVLESASWAVFQEGYESGYGADGDHLKTAAEVRMALGCGFTMITLDCSEHIDNKAAAYSTEEAETAYCLLPEGQRDLLEKKYLGVDFNITSEYSIRFSRDEFIKAVLIYNKAIEFATDIYNNIIKVCGRDIDFEMSIDETLTSTSPASHFFAARELIDGGVSVTSLAPRFCGEFQKGIDYRGELAEFEREFGMHAEIAKHFGYKLSVHSGSDKFTVFPIIGRLTGGRYHLKTAGTNWLEAVRLITLKNPSLYRRMHSFALENLSEARKYYHISAEPQKIPDIREIADEDLHCLMDKDDSRQVLHITYGLILQAAATDKSLIFRDEIFETIGKYEDEYYKLLIGHIGKHLDCLGVS